MQWRARWWVSNQMIGFVVQCFWTNENDQRNADDIFRALRSRPSRKPWSTGWQTSRSTVELYEMARVVWSVVKVVLAMRCDEISMKQVWSRKWLRGDVNYWTATVDVLKTTFNWGFLHPTLGAHIFALACYVKLFLVVVMIMDQKVMAGWGPVHVTSSTFHEPELLNSTLKMTLDNIRHIFRPFQKMIFC